MLFGFQCINGRLVWWLTVIHFVAGITLTVSPSNIIEANQVVTLQCELDTNPPPPILARFADSQRNSLCVLEPNNGKCKNISDPCLTQYKAYCPNETVFSIQVNVSMTWNGASIYCDSPFSRSNTVNLKVIVPVTSVTLTPTPITLIAGQQVNLSCTTSYCNPPANITWYLSTTDITSQSTQTEYVFDGLFRTTSSLQNQVVKTDNGKQVYCTATNIPGQSVNSLNRTVTVWYKPEVASSTSSPYTVIEGGTANLGCKLTDANPKTSVLWKWFKTDSLTDVLYNGSRFVIHNIQRDRSGSYHCIASNSVGTSVAVTIYVDIQYKPEVKSTTRSPYIVAEGETATMECRVTAANPSSSIKWRWYKTDNLTNILHNGPRLTIPEIHRDMSGSYSCTASNSIGTSEVVDIYIDIQYRPEVISNTLSLYRVIEGHAATFECRVTAANPSFNITWRWYKADNPNNVLHNGPTYTIQHIERDRSGSYDCTASNSIGTSFPVNTYLDVQYKPEIIYKPSTLVNESEKVILTRTIDSNPLADVYWYRGQQLLNTQLSVKNATFIIEKALCTDTDNFTLVASNKVERNVTSLVKLLVNCKPMVDNTFISLGVTDTAGVNFSTIVIAYPEPQYELEYKNGTRNNQLIGTSIRNAVNNFTINFHQKTVEECDFGKYHLIIRNLYGMTTIIVNIFKRRKPDNPRNIGVTCEATHATVQWISSFNGGDHQTFIIFALNGQQGGNRSIRIPDMGENKIHEAYVQNLQSSMTYVFYVSAQNNHGFSISDIISCMTSKEINNNQTGAIAGSVAGTLVLITIVLVIVFLIHKRYIITFQKRKSEKVNKANKDASLYTTITEQQQENSEKNMYDELTGNESARHYEAVLMKETQGNNEKLYEKLRKSQSDGYDGERNSNEARNSLQSSMDDRSMIKAAEEYANTTFIK